MMSFGISELVARAINIVSIPLDELVQSKLGTNHGITGNNSHVGSPENRRILQPIWDLRLGREDHFASPLFPVFLCVGFYFSFCTLFMIFDLWGKKWHWIQKYKIQTKFEVTGAMVWDTIKVTYWNHVLFILPAAVAQWVFVPPVTLPELAPTLFEFVWHQAAGLFIFDFQYFVWHWSHHQWRFLYKHVHALHHLYHAPFCWVTQYLHPWELVTVGFLTTTNMWFFRCHPLTTWSYMILSIVISVEAHIGFDFPFCLNNWVPFGLIGGAPKHDMHHLKPLTNFQPFFNHWDRIFGFFCPPMKAGGVRPKDLLLYEKRQKETKKMV